MCIVKHQLSVGCGGSGHRCAFGYLSGFFEIPELSLGFFELCLETGVGMEASHSDGACDAAGVDIALEVVAADHTARAHLRAAVEAVS